eukprot:TRINITY_DN19139_c0_g1_i1.p1 TRINITY_DN19139_c0_g1~~TRINITY_DN19139_c0_g1_i1.p1  ORF type:complete len:329 (-),score=55.10 TRINITY_DN19139_c0_g1_i1:807-1721(-)
MDACRTACACRLPCQPLTSSFVSPTESRSFVPCLRPGILSCKKRCRSLKKSGKGKLEGSGPRSLSGGARGLVPFFLVHAMAEETPPSEMTLENALQLLGVNEGATFDEILNAKKAIVDTSGGDAEKVTQVEAAYDILLMQSLSKRRAGNVIDSSIRFADVRKMKAASAGPEWLTGALKNAPVSLVSPPSNSVALQAAVFGALAAWTFAGGLGDESALTSGADVPGLQLAVGFGSSIYFLQRQNVKLGKASVITIGGLVLGATLGNVIESWLRVDIVPVLGVSSPSVIVGEFVLLILCLVSLYVR